MVYATILIAEFAHAYLHTLLFLMNLRHCMDHKYLANGIIRAFFYYRKRFAWDMFSASALIRCLEP